MRNLRVEDFAQLLELTSVRERAAAFSLSQAAATQREAKKRVDELRYNIPTIEAPDEGVVLEKWLVWRDQELRKRQSHLAKCRADYAETAKICGRVIAENAVVKTLREEARESQKRESEARHMEALNLLSHLLPHNVGD